MGLGEGRKEGGRKSKKKKKDGGQGIKKEAVSQLINTKKLLRETDLRNIGFDFVV